MLGLLILIALVAVPLVLLARLSAMMLARLFGVVSHSEVATRAEFARIREQLLLGGEQAQPVREERATPAPGPPAGEEQVEPHWRSCPECGARVASAAITCMQCGRPQ